MRETRRSGAGTAQVYRDFQKQLAGRQLASGYVFVGAESYFADEALTALRDALLTDDFTNFGSLPEESGRVLVDEVLFQVLSARAREKDDRKLQLVADDELATKLNDARRTVEAFDFAAFQGRSSDLDQLLMQIRTPPFTARRRLVVVRDFDKYRKDDQERLLDELGKESELCRLVLITSSTDPHLARLIGRKGCAKFVVEIPSLGAEEAARLIDRWASQHKLKVNDDARLLLLEACGDSLSQLKSELDKVRTFLGPETKVTKDVVRDLAGHWREYQLSEFVDAVTRRDRALALSNLWRLNDWDEEPVKITGWLAGRFMGMLAYGYGDARLWTKPEIATALRHLARIDLRLKTGYSEKYHLLESFVIRRTTHPAGTQVARRPTDEKGTPLRVVSPA